MFEIGIVFMGVDFFAIVYFLLPARDGCVSGQNAVRTNVFFLFWSIHNASQNSIAKKHIWNHSVQRVLAKTIH